MSMNTFLLIGPASTGKLQYARALSRTLGFGPVDHYAYQVAGLDSPAVGETPFRAPHHTISEQGFKGAFLSGYMWRPGEISLAHGGTLVLDELPEFRRNTIDVVREAIGGTVRVGPLQVPTVFNLIATANLCPCGNRSEFCRCPDSAIKSYLARIPTWLRARARVVQADDFHKQRVQDGLES